MSVLSDRDIVRAEQLGEMEIHPWSADRVQPASYDVALGWGFREIETGFNVVDPWNLPEDLTTLVALTSDESYILEPGAFVLGMTVERVRLGRNIVARLEGKSSLGRLGLVIHSTAGWIDPGFNGVVTLEMANISANPIVLHPGMLVGQLAFMPTSSPVQRAYGDPALKSRYQDQTDVTESRFTK